jgi:hypothetical protein
MQYDRRQWLAGYCDPLGEILHLRGKLHLPGDRPNGASKVDAAAETVRIKNNGKINVTSRYCCS